MNKILLKLCQRRVSVTCNSWYPYPSTCLAKECDFSLYKTRKELNKLMEQGLVASQRYLEIGENRIFLTNGYIITDKAKDTDEYLYACKLEQEYFEQLYGLI